jgi:hypothetical protein
MSVRCFFDYAVVRLTFEILRSAQNDAYFIIRYSVFRILHSAFYILH